MLALATVWTLELGGSCRPQSTLAAGRAVPRAGVHYRSPAGCADLLPASRFATRQQEAANCELPDGPAARNARCGLAS